MTHHVSSEIHEVFVRSCASFLGTKFLREAKQNPHGKSAWVIRVGAACANQVSIDSTSGSCHGGTPRPSNGLCCAWGPGWPNFGTDSDPSKDVVHPGPHLLSAMEHAPCPAVPSLWYLTGGECLYHILHPFFPPPSLRLSPCHYRFCPKNPDKY